MPRPSSPSTLLEDAVDVPAWLEADRDTPYDERVRRDREIARALGKLDDATAAVRGWWQAVPRADAPGTGRRIEHARRLIGLGTAVVGALAGASVAAAAFRYDGTEPVNVVRVLALLVVVPFALLLPSLVLAVPGGPLKGLQQALASINVGSLAAAFARRLGKAPPELERLFAWGAARAGAASRFAKWQILYWSQLAGTAFAAAALATGALLVAFTDLAFGWSTTLAVEPETVARLVEAIAAPWRSIAPQAVPSLALIEQSQYFRFDGSGGAMPAAARTLTGWWPFTLLAIATYALLPRLALLVLARVRLRAATQALLLEDPRVTALLDRMRRPDVETTSPSPAEPLPDEPLAAPVARRHLEGRAHAVVWGDCLAPAHAFAYAHRLGVELEQVVAVGGGRALEEDRRTIERLAADGGVRSLLVFTPAWEPPLLEFLDFLAALRARVGEHVSIVVTPVAEDRGPVGELERNVWSRAVARIADPRLYVEAGAA